MLCAFCGASKCAAQNIFRGEGYSCPVQTRLCFTHPALVVTPNAPLVCSLPTSDPQVAGWADADDVGDGDDEDAEDDYGDGGR